jgi:SAM-dependent methyltransferase
VRGPSVTGFSFDAVDAADYERLRPGYSEDAVAWLLTTATRAHDGLVADVAAGTGKFTRMLASAGVAVIAVEPSATMRTVLRSVTRVPVIAAIAEGLPFPNGAFACVCIAQAFHHLDQARTLSELHRVVAPGAYLALVWNVYEGTDLLKQAMDRIIDRYIDPGWPAAVFGDWRAALDGTPLFEAVESRSFQHPHRLPAAGMAALLLTSADVASLPGDVRRAFAREVDTLASTLPSEVVIQAVTRVDVYRQLPRQ